MNDTKSMKNVERIVILYPGDTSSDRINKPANYALSRLLIELHTRGDTPIYLLNWSKRYERYGNIEFIHFSPLNFSRLAARLAFRRNTLIISQTGAYRRCAKFLRTLMPGSRIIVRLGGVYYGRGHLESHAFAAERRAHRRKLAMADVVVCTADGTPVDLYMQQMGIQPQRYRKWLNGFPMVENYGGFTRGNRVVCISRLSHEKSIDYVIRAFAAALPHLREAHTLEIVGDGPELQALRSLTCELGIESSVEFSGYSRDVARHLYSAKLLVSGLANNTVIEAIATNTPVITVELGEMRALYGHVPNVYVVDYPPGGYGRIAAKHMPTIVKDTADRMVTVLNDYPAVAAAAGGNRAPLYSWKQRLQDELDLYDTLLAAPNE